MTGAHFRFGVNTGSIGVLACTAEAPGVWDLRSDRSFDSCLTVMEQAWTPIRPDFMPKSMNRKCA
jgi:hypothetical protein